jgi:murein L,D-transpeptidase YcbB/YkuD
VFGGVPQPRSSREQKFDLPQPVPVFITYLTASARGNGVVFRPDPYGWDTVAMAQMFGPGSELASAD